MASANSVAAALTMLTGKPAQALCVWCLHRLDPHERHPARRALLGGDCETCSYSGTDDMFVAAIPGVPQCPVQALTLMLVDRALARRERGEG